MQNAEAIRRRLDEVKNMKSYTEALTSLADIQFEVGLQACSERSELRKELETLRLILIGNGNPENSLVSRVGVLERCMTDCSTRTSKSIEKIEEALLGDDKGAGLFEKIRSIELVRSNIQKVMWIMIGTVATQIVLAVIKLFQ